MQCMLLKPSRLFTFIGLFLAVTLLMWVLSSVFFSCEKLCKKDQHRCDSIPRRESLTHSFIPSDVLADIRAGAIPSMDDPYLLRFIRNRIAGPSRGPLRTNHSGPHTSQVGQSQLVDRLLQARTGGFFVECGAAEGDFLSNSLFFERSRNWSGILIEADPFQYQKLLKKNRKAHSLNACLSPSKFPKMLNFRLVGTLGGLEDTMEDAHLKAIQSVPGSHVTVQCFPLYSILRALSRTHVDYFSLDVEGAELDILGTVPWDKLRIDVVSIEYRQFAGAGIDTRASRDKLATLRQLFADTGLYEEAAILPAVTGRNAGQRAVDSYGLDVVFKRLDLTNGGNNI